MADGKRALPACADISGPDLPDNLSTRDPVDTADDGAGGTSGGLVLAQKLSWNADYVLTVGREDKSADLDGWVTVTNGSGTAFRNAKLQLVAGDLNRVRQMVADRLGMAAAREVAAPAASMAQEAFSEYHLYTLGRKTTINNNQTKQVSMLSGTDVPINKRYVVDGHAFYYHNAQHPGAPIKDVVQVYYQFKNEAPANLGMPMRRAWCASPDDSRVASTSRR